MSYTALYRKYRPSCFADVVGQPHITSILTSELEKGKVFHAYLFAGPRGTGKTSCAKILAKAVNCLSPKNGDACCECESCRVISAGDSLDITEMDAASNRGIADINNIRDQVNYTPAVSKYRVFIIDEVHMLTTEAFNALLKTLEEPPEHIVFILATTEVHKLPATILSRCQRFDFKRIDVDEICGRIKYVAQKENIDIDDDAAMLIASISDGGMRDALSTLDVCAANGEKITLQTVRDACALAGNGYLTELADFILDGDAGAALQTIDSLYKNSVDMQRLCEELSSHYRNLMLAKTVKNPEKLIICPKDEFDNIITQSKNYRLSLIMLAIRVLGDARSRMSGGNHRAELEMAVVKLCSPISDGQIDSLEERITRLERTLKNGVPVGAHNPISRNTSNDEHLEKSAVRDSVSEENHHPEYDKNPETEQPVTAPIVNREPLKTASKKEKTAKPSKVSDSGTAPFPEWKSVLKELRRTSPLMAGGLSGSEAFVRGNTVLIKCENKIFLDMMREQPMFRGQIKDAIKSVTGGNYGIGPYTAALQNNAPSIEENQKDLLDGLADKLTELNIPADYE